jgi:uncharacterized membrane protein YidH (DUF202 family)
MEIRAAVVTSLIALGLLAIGLGTLSWLFSLLGRFALPVEAYVIVAGLLLVIFTVIAARMLEEK